MSIKSILDTIEGGAPAEVFDVEKARTELKAFLSMLSGRECDDFTLNKFLAQFVVFCPHLVFRGSSVQGGGE